MGALSLIIDAGFGVSLVDGFIEIDPASKLTPTQREFLKQHKAEIIEELQGGNPGALWFNPGEISKNKTDPPATFATPATPEAENSKTEVESRKVAGVAAPLGSENLIVVCYSPIGIAYEVEARDQAHADWLIKWNPKPTKATR